MLLPPLWTVRHPPRLETPCEQDGVSFTITHIQPGSSCALSATVGSIFSSLLTLSFFWATSLMTPFLSLLLSSSFQCYSQYKLWKEVLLFESLGLCHVQCPTLIKSIMSITMIQCVLNTCREEVFEMVSSIHLLQIPTNKSFLRKLRCMGLTGGVGMRVEFCFLATYFLHVILFQQN